MQSIKEIQDNFITAFCEISDPIMQYEFLLQIGAELEEYPSCYRDEEHLIKGCQSKLWIAYEKRGNGLHFWMDSEALIVKGIAAVAIVMCQEQVPEAIMDAKITYIEETDLKDQISVDRFHEMKQMFQDIKEMARNEMKKEKKK